jgi:trans-2,3-dihydro-3-hydroxyanthranilate isomerase
MSTRSHDLTLDYALVDVFAERPLEGNMLAIFTDGRGLSDLQMQALAQEMNLSETTFIIPAENAQEETRAGVRVRIFTTREELAFAGHPTLGTASWLYRNHATLKGQETITLVLKSGLIQVSFRRPEPGEFPAPGDFAVMTQGEPWMGPVLPPADVARALGLSVNDLDPKSPAQLVSTGMTYCVVPLRSLEALSRLKIPQELAEIYLASVGAKFFYCLTPGEAGSGPHFRARMQFYNGEDPATGSAAGCAAAYLVGHKLAAPDSTILIEQGAEIGRRSRLHVQASLRDGRPLNVFVGGRTIPVATGRFLLP